MKYNNETLLEMVELYAEEMGYMTSEEELSERFDAHVFPYIIEAHGTQGAEFTDTVMSNEAYNNWTDELCKDHEIHPEQYNKYCYTGDYAD